jgi:hypothetical protein
MAEEQALSLRDAIDAAVEEVETPPTPETPADEPTPAEQPPMEKVEGEEPPTPEEKPEEKPIEEEVPSFTDKGQDRPPASWKGDAKKVWSELPDAARSEVIRRERQIDQALAQTAESRQIADSVRSIANKYADSIQRWNLPPAKVFQTLLEADRILATSDPVSRAQFMAQLIHDYQVDITALDSALAGKSSGNAGGQSSDITGIVKDMLARELAPFKQRIEADEQAVQQEVNLTIAQMESDSERFPYFQDVRDDMADLIEMKAKRGVYISLEDAYGIATGSNPNISNAQRIQQERANLQQQNQQAARARNAAVSVGGNPSSSTTAIDPSNLRETIAAALDGGRA